jgi:hypothetical protein
VQLLQSIIAIAFVLNSHLQVAHAQAPKCAAGVVPKFEEFATEDKPASKRTPLVLIGDDRHWRTRLRRGYTEPVNFARRYILTYWGCGAECIHGAALDTKTGAVHWLPGSVCCWGSNLANDLESVEAPISFRRDSRLIILKGMINETGISGTHYFKFEGGQFIAILSVPWSLQESP